jgi:hypothetical protein
MTNKKPDYSKDPTHGRPKSAGSKYQKASKSTGQITWAEVDGPSIKSAIDSVTRDGCAIVFSRTSDGGALVLTLLDGPTRVKEYPTKPADAVTVLQDWALTAKGVSVD